MFSEIVKEFSIYSMKCKWYSQEPYCRVLIASVRPSVIISTVPRSSVRRIVVPESAVSSSPEGLSRAPVPANTMANRGPTASRDEVLPFQVCRGRLCGRADLNDLPYSDYHQ